jgi:hypothetical protein
LLNSFAALVVLAAGVGYASAQQVVLKVDLRDQQTPIRDQGWRGTCVSVAVVGAMEAAYKRAGHGDLRLSDEFAHHMTKMMYLQAPDAERPSNRTENHIAVSGGANATCMLYMLCHGLGVPEARHMPYRLRDFAVTGTPDWKNQFVASGFNLNPHHLPTRALRADRYFSVQSCRFFYHATDPKTIERCLRGGHEVIWSFICAGDRTGPVWKYTGPPGPKDGGHAVLLVGYDRTDPENPYFIMKNSWGETTTPGADGYTYISYDYLNYGMEACCITAVRPPEQRPAYAFLGRWRASFAGRKGILDLYRVPGVMQWALKAHKGKEGDRPLLHDRRLGTFYEDGDLARAYRVNGSVDGKKLLLTIDWDRPNLNYDQLGSHRASLTLSPESANLLEGCIPSPAGPAQVIARRLLSPESFEEEPPSDQILAKLPELSVR